MSQFLNTLNIIEITDKIFAIANHPFRYQSDLAKCIITVPIGFETDFASVPRFMPLVYACLGDTAHQPAVIHDWLYYTALVDRPTADKILLEAMKVWGMSDWRAYAIYYGVRIGGWAAWNLHRKLGHPKEIKLT